MSAGSMSMGRSGARLVTFLRAWAPALCTMAAIWMLSSSAAPPVPIRIIPFHDKGAHFLAYATLAFFVAHAAVGMGHGRKWMRVWLFAVYTAVLWGLLDEVHQAFVPGRSPDIVDLLADALGASVGALSRVILPRKNARTAAAVSVEAAS